MTYGTLNKPSRSGGIGRRAGLKIRRGNTRAGSTPAFGTKKKRLLTSVRRRFFIFTVTLYSGLTQALNIETTHPDFQIQYSGPAYQMRHT